MNKVTELRHPPRNIHRGTRPDNEHWKHWVLNTQRVIDKQDTNGNIQRNKKTTN